MNFSLQKLTDYCIRHSSIPCEVLNELERETHLKTLSPQMISGPLQGQLMSMISHLIKPKRILEIGTFTGYATICLAQGLAEGGEIVTIEANPELKHIAFKYFEKAGILDSVNYKQGDAKQLIKNLEGQFDLIFSDAGKQDYRYYYLETFSRLRIGGIMLVDNTLWSGKVAGLHKDIDTQVMDEFNKLIKEDNRVEVILLPIRDGITIVRKLKDEND